MSTQLALAYEVKRLSRQCADMLARLRRGRATNDELSRIARKYTGRISDLRKAGHDVQLVEQDFDSGVTAYALVIDGKEQP